VEVDGKTNKISDSEQVSLLNCIVEDSDDLQNESVLPMASHDVLVGENKNEADEDQNLVCKNSFSLVNHNTKATDGIEAFDTILNKQMLYNTIAY
jgi:cell division control protein 7